MESRKQRGKGEAFSPRIAAWQRQQQPQSISSMAAPPFQPLHPPLPLLPLQTEATCQDQTETDSEQASDSKEANEYPTSGQKLRGVLISHQIHPPASESCYHGAYNSPPTNQSKHKYWREKEKKGLDLSPSRCVSDSTCCCLT